MGLLSSKASEINTEQSTVSLAEHMPCEILAHIFSNMSTKDLITSSRCAHTSSSLLSVKLYVLVVAYHLDLRKKMRKN